MELLVPQVYAVPALTYSANAADLNGGGYADVVSTNTTTNNTSVFYNTLPASPGVRITSYGGRAFATRLLSENQSQAATVTATQAAPERTVTYSLPGGPMPRSLQSMPRPAS